MRPFAAVLFALLLPAVAAANGPVFTSLADGLELAELKLPVASFLGDSTATLVRVDPAKRSLGLYAAGLEPGSQFRTAPRWLREQKLLALVNAGMFEPGGMPTGYSRVGEQALNPAWKKTYRAVLVLDPIDPALPKADILDSECDDVQARAGKYRVVLQSLRMVSCKGKNSWGKSNRKWSSVVLAVDAKKRVLFIHTRSPYDMQSLVAQLLSLPLGIERMIYLEGGPEASLLVDVEGKRIERMGSYETGFNPNDRVREFWLLPNVIGVR